MEFIIAKNKINEPLLEPDKIEIINDQFEIWYYDDDRLPPISVGVCHHRNTIFQIDRLLFLFYQVLKEAHLFYFLQL